MHLLFVYGTLKQGYHNNHRLMDSKMVGAALTLAKFCLYDLGHYPGMVESEQEYQVDGEVYSIDDGVLASCDRLEGHPKFYERKQISVTCQGKDTLVWAYFIQPNYYEHAQPMGKGFWPCKTTLKTT